VPAGPPIRTVTFTVDPSMYASPYLRPRDVYGDLDRVVRTDLFYHYATPICAQRWLDVCEDPAYGHVALLDRLREVAPLVAEALREDAGGRRGLELWSLGPGDGSVDERLLEGLAGGWDVSSYVGLDFSFELLRRSVSRIANAPGLPRDLAVRALCGDFTDLGSVDAAPRDPEAVRLFALTGFTLGNYSETDLLRNIGRLMAEGDYLFLDVRLHDLGPLPGDPAAPPPDEDGTRARYDLDSVRRFVLGPLEVATTVEPSSVSVAFDRVRGLTVVPNALNLVIYCTGLDATMRLTGERVRRDRVDLAVTTSYHLPDLAAWLQGSGFTTVWHGRAGEVGFFLLRRRGGA